jgi:hypothetical protein
MNDDIKDMDHDDPPGDLINQEAWNRESSEIRGLVDREAWANWNKNNKDPYGGCCVKIARRVMEYLDGKENLDFLNIGYSPDLSTPHGIVCHCDYDEGITGFMAGAVRTMVTTCYREGWKFYMGDVLSSYNIDNQEEIDKYITKVVEAELASEDEVRSWTTDLIARWKAENPKEDDRAPSSTPTSIWSPAS